MRHIEFSGILSYQQITQPPAKKPDLAIINQNINKKKKKKKKTSRKEDFVFPVNHRGKNKIIEKRDKYLNLVRELKKPMEHEGDSDASCYWCVWNDSQRVNKGCKRWKSQDEP